MRLEQLVGLVARYAVGEDVQGEVDDARREPLPLQGAGHQLQDGLQELRHTIPGKHSGKGLLVALLAHVGVRVAAEEAVCDVQNPLLHLPPGPCGPLVNVHRHALRGHGHDDECVEAGHPAHKLVVLQQAGRDGHEGGGPEGLADQPQQLGHLQRPVALCQHRLEDLQHGGEDVVDDLPKRASLVRIFELILAGEYPEAVEGAVDACVVLRLEVLHHRWQQVWPLLRVVAVHDGLEALRKLHFDAARSPDDGLQEV
mmetsp:Transcript_16772/g.46881  ORF Transcript_16772/g.46881 Transcript_16772/m.46881 type:complete len:256 (+) Transcript_16772:2282-3049(+)